jgi:hypothetical protein
MMTVPEPLEISPQDSLELYLALQQPATHCAAPGTDYYDLLPEALRCLRLLHAAMSQIPLPQDGPAALHLNWTTLALLRARQALLALPDDPTADTTPPRARIGFGVAHTDCGDWLLDTIVPDQTRLRILTDDLRCPLTDLGTEDARTTADTVRNLIRCLKTYLAEIDLNQAAGCLGFTTEGSLEIPH